METQGVGSSTGSIGVDNTFSNDWQTVSETMNTSSRDSSAGSGSVASGQADGKPGAAAGGSGSDAFKTAAVINYADYQQYNLQTQWNAISSGAAGSSPNSAAAATGAAVSPTSQIAQPPGSGFKENYPAAQGLKFSETKSAELLAYTAKQGEVYQFPDGKQWQITDVRQNDLTGFRAIVLEPTDPADSRVVLSYEGSNVNNPKDIVDWLNNVEQGTGGIGAQYGQAAQIAQELSARYGERLILTGHSLGGGLASYASIVSGAPATTINAAPLSRGTYPLERRGDPLIEGRITQYYVPGEVMTNLTNNPITRNEPFGLANVRPGNSIPVPGTATGRGSSIANHMLTNLATDVPSPQLVTAAP